MATTPPLGDGLELDDRTVLVFGQELDIAHDQPDVANVALVHRTGDTLGFSAASPGVKDFGLLHNGVPRPARQRDIWP
jgi:hypothetical protein